VDEGTNPLARKFNALAIALLPANPDHQEPKVADVLLRQPEVGRTASLTTDQEGADAHEGFDTRGVESHEGFDG